MKLVLFNAELLKLIVPFDNPSNLYIIIIEESKQKVTNQTAPLGY